MVDPPVLSTPSSGVGTDRKLLPGTPAFPVLHCVIASPFLAELALTPIRISPAFRTAPDPSHPPVERGCSTRSSSATFDLFLVAGPAACTTVTCSTLSWFAEGVGAGVPSTGGSGICTLPGHLLWGVC